MEITNDIFNSCNYKHLTNLVEEDIIDELVTFDGRENITFSQMLYFLKLFFPVKFSDGR